MHLFIIRFDVLKVCSATKSKDCENMKYLPGSCYNSKDGGNKWNSDDKNTFG